VRTRRGSELRRRKLKDDLEILNCERLDAAAQAGPGKKEAADEAGRQGGLSFHPFGGLARVSKRPITWEAAERSHSFSRAAVPFRFVCGDIGIFR
jgi:hypothetical protein